jgi:hypothetical protein
MERGHLFKSNSLCKRARSSIGYWEQFVRLSDLNEAGRAADAAREVNGAVVACWLRYKFGSQEVSRDPSQKNDAGGTPAS